MPQPTLLYPNTPYLATATASATDAYAGTAATHVLSAREDTYWRPANTSGAKTLTVDLGEVRATNALALVGEGMDGVLLDVEVSTNGSAWSTVLADGNLFAPVNVGWAAWTQTPARYVRLTFSAFGSAFRVAWVCLCNAELLPYLEQDFDAHNIDEAGEASVSPGGLFLGNVQRRSMRELTLRFGLLEAAEVAPLSAWAAQCVVTGRPWVFVPDTGSLEAFFCWQQKPKFSAPYRMSMYEVAPITATTRAV